MKMGINGVELDRKFLTLFKIRFDCKYEFLIKNKK